MISDKDIPKEIYEEASKIVTGVLRNYDFIVECSKEDREYVGLCEGFPSLSYLADSEEKALEGILKLVVDAVRDGDHGTVKGD